MKSDADIICLDLSSNGPLRKPNSRTKFANRHTMERDYIATAVGNAAGRRRWLMNQVQMRLAWTASGDGGRAGGEGARLRVVRRRWRRMGLGEG